MPTAVIVGVVPAAAFGYRLTRYRQGSQRALILERLLK